MKEMGKRDSFSREKRSIEISHEMIQILQLDSEYKSLYMLSIVMKAFKIHYLIAISGSL